jgi:hypothetical protein
MYLLYRNGGWPFVALFWKLHDSGVLEIYTPTTTEISRIRDLMAQYKDTPCDFADASLLALAEERSLKNILTIDSHFYIYRLANGDFLHVFP